MLQELVHVLRAMSAPDILDDFVSFISRRRTEENELGAVIPDDWRIRPILVRHHEDRGPNFSPFDEQVMELGRLA